VVFDTGVCLPLKSSPDPPCELYRFDLELVASQPDVDDLIKIEGTMNTASSVCFRMTNQVADCNRATHNACPLRPFPFQLFSLGHVSMSVMHQVHEVRQESKGDT
jgi:hypothetical protein